MSWTDVEQSLLGTMKDADVAKMTGRMEDSVSPRTAEFALAAAAGGLLCAAAALALRNLGRTHDRVLEIVSVEEEENPASPNDDLESGTREASGASRQTIS